VQDIQKIAAERASKANVKPVGKSFETEHQRAKKALVKQIESLDGSNIHMIAASTKQSGGEGHVLRVAAYCRVSTDDLDQAISIALQIDEYKKKCKRRVILANMRRVILAKIQPGDFDHWFFHSAILSRSTAQRKEVL
jgi:hypothetical protein